MVLYVGVFMARNVKIGVVNGESVYGGLYRGVYGEECREGGMW